MNGIWLLLFVKVFGCRYVAGPEIPIHRGAQMLNLPFLLSQRQISQVSVADSKGKAAAFCLEESHVLHLLTPCVIRSAVLLENRHVGLIR